MPNGLSLGWGIFWFVVVVVAPLAVLVLGDLADKAFQRRMDATLWRSLPEAEKLRKDIG